MTERRRTVGVLHPGSMGAAVAGQLRRAGHRVLWLPEGRSGATHQRAEVTGLTAVTGPHALMERADVVLSLCPPAAAEDVARKVAETGGAVGTVYVEANAIAPRRVRRIARRLSNVRVVDGAVVGSPPGGGKRPALYVSGPGDAVAVVGELFAGTDVRVCPLGEEIGKASALKLSYTSYQKASRVLAAVAYGLADAQGVADELLDIAAQRPGSYLVETGYIPKTAARAWRWGPEMTEAAEVLRETGLPDGLLRAAAAALSRWEEAKDTDLTVSTALELLRDGSADQLTDDDTDDEGGEEEPGRSEHDR